MVDGGWWMLVLVLMLGGGVWCWVLVLGVGYWVFGVELECMN
jgi:hypothetical protein